MAQLTEALHPGPKKTVLITGSNQGIGLALAKEFCRLGWAVIATHRRAVTPESLSLLHTNYPQLVLIGKLDVSSGEDVDSLASRLAGRPIDMLICNAALKRTKPLEQAALDVKQGGEDQQFGTLDYELFDAFMHTNVAGPLRLCERFLANLLAGSEKKIVMLGSAAGCLSAEPQRADHFWYRISKAALSMAVRLLAVELRSRGVAVFSFHPGFVRTDGFQQLNRPGMVEPSAVAEELIATSLRLSMDASGRFMKASGQEHPW